MVKLGFRSFRKVENIHLSRMACLIIAENADGKKPQVQMAKKNISDRRHLTTELLNNSLSSNILLYKQSKEKHELKSFSTVKLFDVSETYGRLVWG